MYEGREMASAKEGFHWILFYIRQLIHSVRKCTENAMLSALKIDLFNRYKIALAAGS